MIIITLSSISGIFSLADSSIWFIYMFPSAISFIVSILSAFRKFKKYEIIYTTHYHLSDDFQHIITEIQFIKNFSKIEEENYNKIEILYKKIIDKNISNFNITNINEFITNNESLKDKLNKLNKISTIPIDLVPDIVSFDTLFKTVEISNINSSVIINYSILNTIKQKIFNSKSIFKSTNNEKIPLSLDFYINKNNDKDENYPITTLL
jgi:hypothetical protein